MEGVRAGADVGIPRAFFREALNLALEAVRARKRSRTVKVSSAQQSSIGKWNSGRRSPKKKRD
jgi:hypothetical protein